jgi:GTP cyclohydrolase I
MPIVGHVWVGVIPSDKLLGLSKFARLAEWVFARPQIQEEATEQLADEIQEALNPIGLGVVCKAEHMCMTLRGVRSNQSLMTTSVMKGALFEDQTARSEFMDLIKGQDY